MKKFFNLFLHLFFSRLSLEMSQPLFLPQSIIRSFLWSFIHSIINCLFPQNMLIAPGKKLNDEQANMNGTSSPTPEELAAAEKEHKVYIVCLLFLLLLSSSASLTFTRSFAFHLDVFLNYCKFFFLPFWVVNFRNYSNFLI